MGINTASLSGNVGQDPDMRWLQDGSAVINFSLAVQNYRNKEKPFWFPCKAFGKLAETIGEYVRKGSPVTVSGALEIEEWDDPTIGRRSKTVLNVRDIQLPPKGE